MAEPANLRIVRHNPAFWTATFDRPPINLIGPSTICEIDALVTQLETDPAARVIVFDSADPDFFIAHYDVRVDKARTVGMAPGNTPTGMHPWLDVLARLSRVPAVTIASIRGRARGAGSEFALACDLRFASAEKAILGQFEVGLGAVPGGGSMARLPRLIGRGRALEVLLGADDFPAPLAERYGYINRALPDAELDSFVDRLARRIASFEKSAIAETKGFVNEASLPPDEAFPPGIEAFFRSTARPATRARTETLLDRGLQLRSEVELCLGHYVAASPPEPSGYCGIEKANVAPGPSLADAHRRPR